MPPNPNQTRNKKVRKGPPRPTTARGPHGGLLLSLMLHAGLIAGTYLTWQHMMADSDVSHAVPVELITITKQTNVRAEAPPPDKVIVPKQEVEQPALPQFASAEPAPEPPLPQIKIKPDTTDSDKPDDNPKAAAKDFSALLNKLAAPSSTQKNAKVSDRTIKGIGAQNLMTADLSDSLKSQIDQCWSPPVGAPNAADLVVNFALHLNRDGTVGGLQLTPDTIARASGNPYTQAAAEAASRAIYQCQGKGYHLPLERYSEWSEINPLRFDPRQMMNQ